MKNSGASLRTAVDVWRVDRAGGSALAARQQARLAELVAFARERSPHYRMLYRGLPPRVSDVRLLPPVTRTGLMEDFDG